uniref:Uncharacterized protein n=1 Tax=Rhizobium rhizogenes TaxID=359 RepID=A0A7S4ZSH0_RHIRH|nr:hypothetical protein pC5.7c_465 [Rhizobium rhizogenes]
MALIVPPAAGHSNVAPATENPQGPRWTYASLTLRQNENILRTNASCAPA